MFWEEQQQSTAMGRQTFQDGILFCELEDLMPGRGMRSLSEEADKPVCTAGVTRSKDKNQVRARVQ
jgi:hypothetical protein